jgi:LPXTG-motif cell wall-anchored protein
MKFSKFLSIILVLLVVLSGCTVAFRGELRTDESFYLQMETGETSLTEVNNSQNIYVGVDPSVTVGGFIESPLGTDSVYWVPKYHQSNDGYTYYDLFTEVGLPTKKPAGASVNGVLINPMKPNQVLVSINVLDQQSQNIDGYTHVFVSETSPKNNITFYDFDFVGGSVMGTPDLELENEPSTEELVDLAWKTGDSTSTIFGYYHIDDSFFDKFELSRGQFLSTTLHPLLDQLGENTESPKDGVVDVLSTINETVWNKGNFSLDLKTGTSQFATLNVTLPNLTAEVKETGTVLLNWPAVFGDVTGYRIFQDDQQIAEVTKETTSLEVTNLTVGNIYQFTVKGILQLNGEAVESTLGLSASQLVSDMAAPVITLNGDNPLSVEQGTPYIEPGFTAMDDVEGDVTDKVTVIGQVDSNTLGEYQLVYSVTDLAGNKVELTRIVKVVDKTAPVITLNGDNPMTINQGSKFIDPGFSATDAGNGDVTDSVTVTGEVDSKTPGEYKLVYKVTDSSGNKSEATRIVTVREVLEPNNGEKANDSPLPNTATNQYNWLLAGALMILLGALMLLIVSKKRLR